MRERRTKYDVRDYYRMCAHKRQNALDDAVREVKAGRMPHRALAEFLRALVPYQEHGVDFKIEEAMSLLEAVGRS